MSNAAGGAGGSPADGELAITPMRVPGTGGQPVASDAFASSDTGDGRGETYEAFRGGAAAVQFNLETGEIPVSISVPRHANANIVVVDSSGHIARTIALIDAPMYGFNSCGFRTDGSDGSAPPEGMYTTLPKGTYTASISASDGSPLPLHCRSQPLVATSSIVIRGNLDSTAFWTAFDSTRPKDNCNFMTAVTIYSELGVAIQVDIYFSKNNPFEGPLGDSSSWTYHALTDGKNLAFEGDGTTPATPGKDAEVATGTLRFYSDGRLNSNVLSTNAFFPKGATGPQSLSFDFGTGTSVGGSGLDGLTQHAAASTVERVSQDGWYPWIACRSLDDASDANGPALQQPFADPFASTSDIAIAFTQQGPPRDDGSIDVTACVCSNDQAASPRTTNVAIRGNLDQNAQPLLFDVADPQGTSNVNAVATTYDSLGNVLPLNFYFSRDEKANSELRDRVQWTYAITTGSGNPTLIAMGTLLFDLVGRLVLTTATFSRYVPQGATRPLPLEFNFGTGTAVGGTGLDGVTHFPASSDIQVVAPEPCSLGAYGVVRTGNLCVRVH